jgi:nucleobase transporter 1/2
MTDVEAENEVPPKVVEVEESSSEEEDLKKEATANEEDIVATKTLTYKEQAKAQGMNYTVTDVPPLGTAMLLGTQHYLTMLGATVLVPLIICPAMGADGNQTAQVISSIFFVSGINTLLQTTIGDRCVLFTVTDDYN